MVVELARRGKLVVGEPFFVPGVPLVLDRKGLGEAGPGDLAVVEGPTYLGAIMAFRSFRVSCKRGKARRGLPAPR